MENKNVAAFLKVAELNHFTKAAEHLGYSQAAVTAQIKALEKELGVLLFDRMGKKIRLTQAGQAFLPYAYNMLKAEEEAISSVRSSGKLKGELRICAGSSYAAEVLPHILLHFKEAHPDVNVVVRISDYPEDTTQKLARGDIDFLVCMDELSAYPEFLTVYQRPEPVIFVTYPSNPLLRKKDASLPDILADNFLSADREIGYCALLEKELRRKGIEMKPVMELGSVEAIIRILLGGYGVSLLPEFVVKKYLDRGELAEVKTGDIPINLYSYYLCSRHRWINPVMQEFLRIAEEQVPAVQPGSV